MFIAAGTVLCPWNLLVSSAANGILGALTQVQFASFIKRARLVNFERDDTLYEPERQAKWVYFPTAGLLSVLTVLKSGRSVATAMVGPEGSVGFIEASGSGVMHSRVRVQSAGKAWRAPASAYASVLASSPELQGAVRNQTDLLVTQLQQAVICHAVHTLDMRLCRWLLECQDHFGESAPLPLTHECLAAMLGVQRTTVTAGAGALQNDNLIRYAHGKVTIMDRLGLEQRTCECRQLVVASRRSVPILPQENIT
ncbi:MAG: Crp/Fnr family transcriptional regulator [Caulobacteraceae bacterium]